MMGSSDTLSEYQREILRLAVREGYFETPRRITLEELSDVVGVADVRTSEEIRQALDTHLRETVCRRDDS
ncbi:helix-turn-helix domain-containing protein [Halogeometricum luteum]|uniref:Helix-turn-helix domain-containing protein n=1 Tax=Halogeometricum luteum TaxID=2950537 RepID=A0ABU2FYV3_9EURY|nr:helix-turn-helix domain-containing protein [Halogeometricum sp. S3BR5-2]MDS0293711.1 helix-turn-helix domain-containing protein [Halogeometricum sp. S3BR5-2]